MRPRISIRGSVRPSVRRSVRPSVGPSVRPQPLFSAGRNKDGERLMPCIRPCSIVSGRASSRRETSFRSEHYMSFTASKFLTCALLRNYHATLDPRIASLCFSSAILSYYFDCHCSEYYFFILWRIATACWQATTICKLLLKVILVDWWGLFSVHGWVSDNK